MGKALVMFIAACSMWLSHGQPNLVECKLNNGVIVHVAPGLCKKMTNLPTPTPTSSPTPTVAPTPTPTPALQPTITRIERNLCSGGSSCSGWLLGVEVFGSNFAADSRVKLVNGNTEYTGSFQGGDGSGWILTDFTNLPRCEVFDAVVFGSTGTASAAASVSSVCQ